MAQVAAKAGTGGYRLVIEGLVLIIQISIGLSFLAPAPLFPLIVDTYGVDRATLSLLVGAVTLVMALFTMPASVIAARMGLKRAYAMGALLMAAGLLTPIATSFPMLLALRLIFGLGAAMIVPTTGALMMQWFDSRELPLVNSLNIVAQSVGVTASMFLTVLVAQNFGWQAPLILYGGIALVAALAWAMLGREHHGAEAAPQAASLREITSVFSQRNTLILGMGLVGAFGLYLSLSSWLPSYYSEVRGIPLATASAIAGLLPFMGIAGSILGGILATRTGLRRPFIMFSGSVTAVAALGAFLTGNLPLIYFSAAFMGVVAWLYLPAAFTIPMELPGMTPEKVGVVLATAMAMGNLSGFVSPLLTGYLADVTGSYLPGFLLWTIASLSLFASGFLLPETGPRAKRPLATVGKAAAEGEGP